MAGRVCRVLDHADTGTVPGHVRGADGQRGDEAEQVEWRVVDDLRRQGPGVAVPPVRLRQKLLEAVFGDQAVRSLAERAKRRLEASVSELLDSERRRYTDLLGSLGIDPEAPERLRKTARKVDDLRFAAHRAPQVSESVSDPRDGAP